MADGLKFKGFVGGTCVSECSLFSNESQICKNVKRHNIFMSCPDWLSCLLVFCYIFYFLNNAMEMTQYYDCCRFRPSNWVFGLVHAKKVSKKQLTQTSVHMEILNTHIVFKTEAGSSNCVF